MGSGWKYFPIAFDSKATKNVCNRSLKLMG